METAQAIEQMKDLSADLADCVRETLEKLPIYEVGQAFLECETCGAKLYKTNREIRLYENVEPSGFEPISPQNEPAGYTVNCNKCKIYARPVVTYGRAEERRDSIGN